MAQPVCAAIVELYARTRDEIDDGPGNQYFVRRRERGNAGTDVGDDAAGDSSTEIALAGVQPEANWPRDAPGR